MRLVCLKNGCLSIFRLGASHSEPLLSTRIVDVKSIKAKCRTIKVVTEHNKNVKLNFKDNGTFELWSVTLRRERQIKFENFYSLGEEIGRGAFARVFRATDKRTGEIFAVKVIQPDSQLGTLERSQCWKYINREIEIAKLVNHKNVVGTVDVFRRQNMVFCVMEFVAGTLWDHLLQCNVEEDQASDITAQLLQAVEYLHSVGVVHRDIKPQNILFSSDGTVKLADFGLATQLYHHGSSDNRLSERSDSCALNSILGTPAFCAPEMLGGFRYGKPVDIYSIGVLTYAMLSGRVSSFHESPERLFRAVRRTPLLFPGLKWARVSPEAVDLCRRMINRAPSSRPSAGEALRHPWFRTRL